MVMVMVVYVCGVGLGGECVHARRCGGVGR
jgi:hypothetical protein